MTPTRTNPTTRFKQPLQTRLARSLLLFGAAFPLGAMALGLGAPLNTPVIGQALRLEIPVSLVPGERPPAADCVRMTLPPDSPDRQFFPRNVRVSLDTSKPGAVKVVIVSPLAVTEPIIEFRLVVGCQNELAKDFLVLTSVPEPLTSGTTKTTGASSSATTAAPVITATAGSEPAMPQQASAPVTGLPHAAASAQTSHAAPVRAPAPTPATAASVQSLRLTQNTNLNALARIRYPSSQATRDEYRRLMGLANPELFAGKSQIGSIPLPAGTVLTIPPNLPPPENEKKAEQETPAAAVPKPAKPVPAEKSGNGGDTAATPRKDRLVIGGDSLRAVKPLNPRELASAIERMERMVEDQGRTEVELSENLKTLSAAFIEVKDYLVALEAKTRQLEAEQKQQQLKADARPEPKSLGMFELLALILAGGAVGAGLLGLQHRLQLKRLAAAEPTGHDTYTDGATNTTAATPPAPVEPLKTWDLIAHPVSQTAATPATPATITAAAPKPTPKPASAPAPVPPASKAPPVAVSPAPTFVPPSAPAVKAAPTVTPITPAEPNAPLTLELPPSLGLALEPREASRPELDVPLEFMLPSLSLGAPEPEVAPSAPEIHAMATPDLSESDEDAAMELAAIMESMGLAKEAARTLVEHIYIDPKRDLAPWLKALSIYRKTGQREEFDALAQNLRQHLNVQPRAWDETEDLASGQSLIEYRHLVEHLQQIWRKPDCEAFLIDLLSDNRQGTRAGFPQEVAEEILLLQRILRDKT
jgi:hypothetical protein